MRRCAVCAVSDAECSSGCVPEISHAIPLWVLQLLKSERWNSAVFGVGHRAAVRELHAKLVRVARRVLLHAATLLRARGACPATVLLRAATPRLLRRECRALVLLRVPGRLRRLACRLLGAGVCLDLFGGEGALCGAFAAVGALP